MDEAGVARKLAAILAADVAGYSALMERDEAGTLDRLNRLLATSVSPAIQDNSGRIVKLMGDGVLAEFASVHDAVRCAREIQDRNRRNNLEAGDCEAMSMRIGVHLGDVIVQREDIFGNGVNIAARLQALAEPGGIAVSEEVFWQLDPHNRNACRDLGTHRVKNIARPVRAHALATAGTVAAAPPPRDNARPVTAPLVASRDRLYARRGGRFGVVVGYVAGTCRTGLCRSFGTAGGSGSLRKPRRISALQCAHFSAHCHSWQIGEAHDASPDLGYSFGDLALPINLLASLSMAQGLPEMFSASARWAPPKGDYHIVANTGDTDVVM